MCISIRIIHNPKSPFIIFTLWAQPYNNRSSNTVDIFHSLDLVVSFSNIFLVDTQRVNPESHSNLCFG